MPRAALCAAVGFLLSSFGCGEDARTPDCPALPLYDVRVSARREALRPELTEAADRGCITLPTGFAVGDDPDGKGGSGNGGNGNGGSGNGGDGGDGNEGGGSP